MKAISLLFAAAAAANSLTASLALAAHSNLGGQPRAAAAILVEAAADKVYKGGPLVIQAPWTRAPTVGGPSLKITNAGAEAARLVGGSLPIAAAVEVHAMSMTDGVMKMRKLETGLEIKPGQTVELKPGGYHLMFTGLRQALQQGQPVK